MMQLIPSFHFIIKARLMTYLPVAFTAAHNRDLNKLKVDVSPLTACAVAPKRSRPPAHIPGFRMPGGRKSIKCTGPYPIQDVGGPFADPFAGHNINYSTAADHYSVG